MKLVIKFPTRNRPEKFLFALNKYVTMIEDKTTPIIVTCDNDDESMKQDFVLEFVAEYPNVILKFGDNKTKIEAVNADLKDVDFDIVLLASDDMIPMVKGFDNIIRNKMIEHYPDTDGVLWFNDGFKGDELNTLCILGKKYYDRFDYIYNPEYVSVWSDNEFMCVGKLLGRQTYFNEVIIKHQHPDWGFGQRDVIHALNAKNEEHDRLLFDKRKLINFGV